jgi:excisionase family DNA binding protein
MVSIRVSNQGVEVVMTGPVANPDELRGQVERLLSYVRDGQ